MLVPPTKFVWDTMLAAKMFWYSLPLGLSQGVSQISRQIDRLVIGRFMSTEFFATFTWAAMALPFVPEISESVMTVLTPEFARLHKDGDNAQFLSIWHESIRKTSIIILGVFGLVEALAEPIIIALYSAKYADSVPYFRLYQIGLLVRVTVFGAILQSLGETRQILYASIFMLAVKALTSVALFKMLGPVGPVIASLILTGLLSVYFLFFISRRLGTNLRRVWPWLSYAKILAAAVLAGAAALAVYAIPKESIASALAAVSVWLSTKPSVISAVELAIGSAIFALVYVLVLHATGSLKAKDWQLLKAMTYGRFAEK
jgi:O-antigen/teichoic acid export membrane protein